jgi:predicted membrane protein
MNNDDINAEFEHKFLSWQKSNKRSKIATGLLVITFGVLFLLKELGYHIPEWVFRWEMILISVGIIVIIRSKFRSLPGYLMILIGKLFLLHQWYPDAINMRIIWPILIIIAGLGIIFKSRRKRHCRDHRFHGRHKRFNREHWKNYQCGEETPGFMPNLDDISQDDFIDAVSIFGGVHKNVVSKQFRGADIVTMFGGNELNLSQADFTDKVIMDVTNIFGGTTLVVPNNWQIKSEMVVLFGDIQDKRIVHTPQPGEIEKVVILKGTCLFGGIEINSFNS